MSAAIATGAAPRCGSVPDTKGAARAPPRKRPNCKSFAGQSYSRKLEITPIDFAAINRAALAVLPAVLCDASRWTRCCW